MYSIWLNKHSENKDPAVRSYFVKIKHKWQEMETENLNSDPTMIEKRALKVAEVVYTNESFPRKTQVSQYL